MSKREQIEREFSEKKHEIELRFMQLEVIQAQADKTIREGFKAMRDKELEALSQEYGFPVVAQTVEASDLPKPPGLTGFVSE
ncbi:MAG: hypothetical protein ACKO0Z_25615 [Betaproteobacteria bacterium]